MACPCFYPLEQLGPLVGGKSVPMPLGEAWAGQCRAPSQNAWKPDPGTARQLCNLGYARGKCARFPAGFADAVRFTISHDREGVIGVYWVMEKEHLPFGHGPLEYSRRDGCFKAAPPDACLAQQAGAYVSSYLRRKGDAARA
jgi:hypothetical protein